MNPRIPKSTRPPKVIEPKKGGRYKRKEWKPSKHCEDDHEYYKIVMQRVTCPVCGKTFYR